MAFLKVPPLSVDSGQRRENMKRWLYPSVGEMTASVSGSRGKRFLYGSTIVMYSYLGWSSFQRGEMISILNCPEKLMHIFFENPVTCSPYSVSLTYTYSEPLQEKSP